MERAQSRPEQQWRAEDWVASPRRGREVVRYAHPVPDGGGEPRFLSAEEMLDLPVGAMMAPDEFLDAKHRRGVWTACRQVDTVGRDEARGAGL